MSREDERLSPLATPPPGAIDYRAYLRTEAWRRKRILVIRRAGGICERCRRWPIVNVHHLTYERLGDEWPSDLLGVCVKCHGELHGKAESI